MTINQLQKHEEPDREIDDQTEENTFWCAIRESTYHHQYKVENHKPNEEEKCPIIHHHYVFAEKTAIENDQDLIPLYL